MIHQHDNLFIESSLNYLSDIFVQRISDFAEKNHTQVYLIKNPLSEKYNYDGYNCFLTLIQGYKILIVNVNETNNVFDEFYEDVLEDFSSISDKYDFKEYLGRNRDIKTKFFEKINLAELSDDNFETQIEKYRLIDTEETRKTKVIISLLTGSINEAERITGDYPYSRLDEVKKNIVLFDSNQTRFLYEESPNKTVSIQGLAGTGKTELLLHKLKEIYLENDTNRVAFTCHNIILADSLKNRIPEFFDYLRVEKQLLWNKRIWAFRSWGSYNDINSGLYRYICNFYKISFYNYSQLSTFKSAIQHALVDLNSLIDLEPCFDYILIDESQDFPDEFFDLCKKVTKNKVYIAGDIFQNIFVYDIIKDPSPDFLLNKCYRTDPRTLMFAHGVGIGLFEEIPIRWLNEKEWIACGYVYEDRNDSIALTRKPLNRFNGSVVKDSVLIYSEKTVDYANKIMSIIDDLKVENPTIKPDDIGIIFLENNDKNHMLASILSFQINSKYGWEINKGFETKKKKQNTLFISNKNNAKGLEFSFIICILNNDLSNNIYDRNTLYMILTRSFIRSYLLLPDYSEYYELLQNSLNYINENEEIVFKKQPKEIIEKLQKTIFDLNQSPKSLYDLIEQVIQEFGVTLNKDKVHTLIKLLLDEETYIEKSEIISLIQSNLSALQKQ